MRKFLINFFVLFSIFSCATKKRCSEKFPVKEFTSDTTIIKDTVVIQHDTVLIPGKTVEIHDTIPCPDYHAESGGLIIDISSGKLTAKCKSDSLQMIIQNLRQNITKERIIKIYEEKPPQIINKPLWYHTAALWWFVISLLIIIFYLLRKIRF